MLPDRPEVRQLVGYVLGLCLNRYGLELHAACFMSNHYHLDVTDPNAELPAFKCLLNSLIARGLNCLRGRFDSLWSGDTACDVELVQDEDVLDRMAYTIANPTAAGLVRRACRWPGLTTAGMSFGETLTFKRPSVLFDPDGDLPDEVTFALVRPDILHELDDEQLSELLLERVRTKEIAAAQLLRAEHRRFMGAARLLRQRWNLPPRTFEIRFRRTPRVSSRSKWARIAALQRNAVWSRVYGDCLEAWQAGDDVEFPYGTYALRRFAAVRVAAGP